MAHEEPLGVPRGSVRAILALMMVAAFVIVQALAVHHFLGAEQYEAAIGGIGLLAAEAGVVLGFYFGQRPPAS